MSIYGYMRISTSKQSIERQVRNIEREYPGAVIIREAYTGTKLDRKEWGKLFSVPRDTPIASAASVTVYVSFDTAPSGAGGSSTVGRGHQPGGG